MPFHTLIDLLGGFILYEVLFFAMSFFISLICKVLFNVLHIVANPQFIFSQLMSP